MSKHWFSRGCAALNITLPFIIYRSGLQSVESKERQLNTGELTWTELWSQYNRRGTEQKKGSEKKQSQSQKHINSCDFTKRRYDTCAVPVVDGSSSQHHRVIVGPFGCVAPTLFVAVPEVAASWITHDTLGETLPDGEGKVHLDRQTETQILTWQQGQQDMENSSRHYFFSNN